MKFKCSVCREYVEEKIELMDGFCEIAYNSFEWLDRNVHIPALNDDIWQRSNELPDRNEHRFLKVLSPFNEEIGSEFNVLYMPAMSYFNDWSEYPDEISKSAIIRCKFEKVIDADEFRAWIEVLVLSVTKLENLCEVYPVRRTDKLMDKQSLYDEPEKLCYGSWEYFVWSVQGDIGQWHLIFIDREGLRHLILFGKWDFHSDFVQCGNLIL